MAEKLIVIGGTAAGLSAASRARKENLTWRFKSLKNPDLSAMEPAVFPIL